MTILSDKLTAADRLHSLVKDLPFFLAVGIGDGCLIVYVERVKLSVLDKIPASIGGFPVTVKRAGAVRPAGPEAS